MNEPDGAQVLDFPGRFRLSDHERWLYRTGGWLFPDADRRLAEWRRSPESAETAQEGR
jgi:hypothetical protein